MIVVCVYAHGGSCVTATATVSAVVVLVVIVAAVIFATAVAAVATAKWTPWLNLVKVLPLAVGVNKEVGRSTLA